MTRLANPLRMAACLAGFCVCALLAGAQPPPPPPDADQPPPDDRQPQPRDDQRDPEAMRHRLREGLQRRIEGTRRLLDRLQRAMDKLDAGASPEEIRQMFPEVLGAGPEGGPGQPGAGGGGDDFPRGFEGAGPGRGDGERGEGGGFGGRRRQGQGGGDEPAPTLTNDDKQAIRDFIRATAPGMIAPLEKLEKENPDKATEKFNEMYPRVRWLIELRRKDPDVYQARVDEIRIGREVIEQARAIRQVMRDPQGQSADKVEPLRTKLRATLVEQFRVRTKISELDMARMQKRLAERPARMDSIVDEELQNLLTAPEPGPGRQRPPRQPRPGAGPDDPSQPPPNDGPPR